MLYLIKGSHRQSKPIVFMARSHRAIKKFSRAARKDAGVELRRVQQGEEPTDWKPLSSIGPGGREIRVHKPFEHRVIYIAHFQEAVYVLHAFSKKTAKTSHADVTLARVKYAEVKKQRKEEH